MIRSLRPQLLVLGMGLVVLLAIPGREPMTAEPATPGSPCPAGAGVTPYLIMETAAGRIEIRLDPQAAPAAIERFLSVVRGPVFNETLFGSNEVGYYDGLTFAYTRPQIEIRTAERQPSGLIQIPVQIDAESLGLHEDKIADINQATDVMQFELLKDFSNSKESGKRTPQLDNLVAHWFNKFDAKNLIGVSRKEINEALGYLYTTGLPSRPVKRGAVALKPLSPKLAGMELTIALSDLDERTGRWMVIGEVVTGLDLADSISTQPLREPPHVRSRTYIPYEPVVIESARVTCR